MTAPRDPDRLIRAFLDEGRTELPDRAYDAVRAEIDRTRQRVVIGPLERAADAEVATFAIAAAAVLMVGAIGLAIIAERSAGGRLGLIGFGELTGPQRMAQRRFGRGHRPTGSGR